MPGVSQEDGPQVSHSLGGISEQFGVRGSLRWSGIPSKVEVREYSLLRCLL